MTLTTQDGTKASLYAGLYLSHQKADPFLGLG